MLPNFDNDSPRIRYRRLSSLIARKLHQQLERHFRVVPHRRLLQLVAVAVFLGAFLKYVLHDPFSFDPSYSMNNHLNRLAAVVVVLRPLRLSHSSYASSSSYSLIFPPLWPYVFCPSLTSFYYPAHNHHHRHLMDFLSHHLGMCLRFLQCNVKNGNQLKIVYITC
jgi:hypothetical protein